MVKKTEKEEYELIPISPIRRLEKRMERIESEPQMSSGNFKDIVDIVKMNQQIVDELAKSNESLRLEISKIPHKIDELLMDLKELISFIKSSGEDEAIGLTQEAMRPLIDKMDEMITTNKAISDKNDGVLEVLDEISKKVRRPVNPMEMRRILSKPMAPPPPPSVPSTQPLKGKKSIKI